jgi:8-amino-7-oxononanoate synthase
LAHDSLKALARDKLARLDSELLTRTLVVTDRGTEAFARRNAVDLVSFACNDYLGLSQHPEVIQAAADATRRLGTGAGASRHISGNHSLYESLETQLASLKGTEDAVVFGSGYLANIGTIPAIVDDQDLIIMDETCHACLHSGARLARSQVSLFAHNDVDAAASILKKSRAKYRHCLLLTEGVFSMDGDRAPIAKLLELAESYDAWLMTDDAHGMGVVGDGRGSNIEAGSALDVPLQMGTLSKAAGAYGGYLCTSTAVADLIRNRARSLVYTTALPPGTVAAAAKALEIIATDRQLTKIPLENARLFSRELGLADAQSAIVPLPVGSSGKALKLSEQLERDGYLVVAIRPPTVPDGTARLRCTFSAMHDPTTVTALAKAVKKAFAIS